MSIRIDEAAHSALRELARKERQPMQAILQKAIESYRRQKFLEEANAAYGALRSDSEAWRHEREERALWDHAHQDGLESE